MIVSRSLALLFSMNLYINFQHGFAFISQTRQIYRKIPFHSRYSQLSSNLHDVEPDNTEKKQALELLDCLTSPTNTEDPQYDVEKDIRRDNLLLSNDYHDLKLELKERGLRTGGDKLEMITRLLLHIIDPNLDYNKMTGHEPNLKYVEPSDIGVNKVKMFPVDQRQPSPTIDDTDLDADDIQITKGIDIFASPSKTTKIRVIMDGLTRREIDYSVQLVTRQKQSKSSNNKTKKDKSKKQQSSPDEFSSMKAYIVAGRDVLKTWQKSASVIVFCPDESGWRSKTNRVLADELAFSNQAIVVVPDIYPNGSPLDISIEMSSESLSDDDRVVLDHIISTLHYCRLEYKPRSICIAGVGIGGTYASSASCDLWDLASVALQQLSSDNDADTKIKNSKKNKEKGDVNNIAGRAVLLEDENKVSDANISSPRIHLGYATKVVIDKTRQQLFEAELELITNQQMQQKDQQLQSKGEGSDDALLLSTTQQVLTAGIEIEGVNTDDIDSTSMNDDSLEEEFDLSKIDSSGIVDSIMKKIMHDTNDSSNHNNTNFDSTTATSIPSKPLTSMSDKQAKRIVTETERKEKETYLRHQQEQLDKLSHENSIQSAQQRQLYNSAQSTLSISDLVYLAPRALLCLNPTISLSSSSAQAELQRLGKGLRLPVAIMYGSSDKDSSDSISLHKLISQRKRQIEDYCLRRYESASPLFMTAPVDMTDTKCRQDAIAIGGIWLDIYSRDAASGDSTRGSGRTKYDENEGMFTVTRSHIDLLGAYPSAVADYLHDDPALLLDYTQQEDEAREKINKKPADVSAKIEEMLNQQGGAVQVAEGEFEESQKQQQDSRDDSILQYK